MQKYIQQQKQEIHKENKTNQMQDLWQTVNR